MSPSRFSKMQGLFIAALLLVVAGALAARFALRPAAAPSSSTNQPVPSSIPDFTSASFPDGDALAGLGADWTYLRQTPLTMNVASAQPGTSSTRESVIKAVGKDTQLLLEESTIVDMKVFEASLTDDSVKKVKVSGRAAYVVPVANISGGTGLLLVGDSTTLLIQDVRSAAWPIKLEPEVLSYIATVRVP